VRKEGAVSFLKESLSGNFLGFKVIPTTETEVNTIACSLK
jgi:hypothetical protein